MIVFSNDTFELRLLYSTCCTKIRRGFFSIQVERCVVDMESQTKFFAPDFGPLIHSFNKLQYGWTP